MPIPVVHFLTIIYVSYSSFIICLLLFNPSIRIGQYIVLYASEKSINHAYAYLPSFISCSNSWVEYYMLDLGLNPYCLLLIIAHQYSSSSILRAVSMHFLIGENAVSGLILSIGGYSVSSFDSTKFLSSFCCQGVSYSPLNQLSTNYIISSPFLLFLIHLPVIPSDPIALSFGMFLNIYLLRALFLYCDSMFVLPVV